MSKVVIAFDEMMQQLEKRVTLLISKNSKIRDENSELKSQVEFLLGENSQWQSKVEELMLLLKDAKLTTAFNEAYDDKKEALKAVEKMLKEIDDCVDLINR